MHTISSAPVTGDDAVDELADAVTHLVRKWRTAGRRVPNAAHSTLALLQLAGLLDEGEHRIGEIAELRGVDQSVVSRQVGELQARGLACRRPDPSDRRAGLVSLTPDGHALVGRTRTLRRDLVRSALERSDAGDVHTVARLVAALAEEIEARADQLTGLS
ncbi:winged helix-turn-helix transcriptional regulator [Pseudonocardia sp. KRD-184]|uniref:Winged helix-turn-helix transcriptional regulator n=1 Tax=Pseudonocardia oceani TaxID=2792013 RepID=A0ABS6U7V0_9PSEU|nr:MarR family winged helix-turn-helix transcriptional regulator [Pseudonocardia oceani]MBW0091454.1 winged helix-turn-helix transcriptional regulator [Pseudonocardia oceani]MBW0099677.1 winged helix-turn-helix transcriptional regulator [Pseudonocardia oceani]MBW0112368.1 winged helix-turn-helix transcriptional regulator [Pseudonocardia oceani]MBW0125598.1 winged helix-turn-helix transcriptional regulator [Pseudonocardia oceani]MBW0128317.1 winged helix-turn-helix transcriptional regulator [Ps